MTARFLAETADASAEIAAALHVAEGARVVVRRSYLRLDQEPWSLVASYYAMDIASGTLRFGVTVVSRAMDAPLVCARSSRGRRELVEINVLLRYS